MAVSLSTIAAKDSAGTAIAGGLQAQDKSGLGTGPFTLGQILIDGLAGTNMANVTATNALKVDGSAVTQPVSGTITATLGSTQNTNLANIDSQTSRLTSSATNITAGSALATTSLVVGTRYLSTPPTFTNGQEGALQIDSAGRLIVNVGAGGAGGGAVTNAGTFAVQDTVLDAALAIPTTPIGTVKELMVGGSVTTNAPTYTTGQINPLSLDTAGSLRTTIVNANANVTNAGDAVTASTLAGAPAVTYGYGYNGATWDRLQVDASKNLKTAATLGAETTKVIGTVNVAAAQAIALEAATSGGLTRTRTLILANTTAVVVKSGAGQLYKIRATNNSATIAYIKLYDATTATAGAGTIVDTIMIPASTSGAGIVDSTDVGTPFTTGLTFIVTTGIADADTAAPAASAYVVTMYYK